MQNTLIEQQLGHPTLGDAQWIHNLSLIQRQVKYLDEIRTWSGTIKNSAEKVIDRVERMQKALDGELETLGQQFEQLKSVAG